ncbi:MAG TPA: terminase family protein [Agromyces sp.]
MAAPTQHEQELLVARTSPAGLAYYASRHRYRVAPHLAYLNRRLVDLAARRGKRNLAVFMPPRHGKSETCSRYFPPWYMGTYPDHGVILSSYEADFAASWGRAGRDVLEEYGDEVFGVQVQRASRAAKRWQLVGREGRMQTAGVGGAITGKGANLLVIDDPVKNHKEALSKERRDDVWDWWLTTASTRREVDLATGLQPITLLIMTRWHEDDLAGRLLEQEPDDWEVVNFPLLAREGDVLGRQPGEVLWPARVDEAEAIRIRDTSTPFWFGALYQQTPKPDDGGIVKRSWIRYFDQHPDRSLFDERGWPKTDGTLKPGRQSWDMTFKDTSGSDYVVGGAWWMHGADRFLVDVDRKKRSFTSTIDVVKSWNTLHPKLRTRLVEDKANGPAVISALGRNVSGLVPWSPDKHGSKEARLHVSAPAFRSGNVWLPRPTVPNRHDPPLTEGVPIARAEWVADYVEELVTFPNATHDDQVDMTTMALIDMESSRKPRVGAVGAGKRGR